MVWTSAQGSRERREEVQTGQSQGLISHGSLAGWHLEAGVWQEEGVSGPWALESAVCFLKTRELRPSATMSCLTAALRRGAGPPWIDLWSPSATQTCPPLQLTCLRVTEVEAD